MKLATFVLQILLATVVVFSVGVGLIFAQEVGNPEAQKLEELRRQGFELYSKGQCDEVIQKLNAYLAVQKTDARAWDTLGRCYDRLNLSKKARNAFSSAIDADHTYYQSYINLGMLDLDAGKYEDAVSHAKSALAINSSLSTARYVLARGLLGEGNSEKALEEAKIGIQDAPVFKSNYLLISRILVGMYSDGDPPSYTLPYVPSELMRTQHQEELKVAIDNLEKYNSLTLEEAELRELQGQLKILRRAQSTVPISEDTSASTNDTSSSTNKVKARILSRPEPRYTIAARENGITGTVVLKAILSSDGKIRGIIVAHGLSHGLTEEAVLAARKITFTPAMVDGKAVPEYIQIEYTFKP